MQIREKLLDNYPKLSVEYDPHYPVKGGGYYERSTDFPNGLITITDKVNYYLQNSIIAEEIGHHETSYGNVLSYYNHTYNVDVARQELRARRFGHKLIIPLERLIECYELGIWEDLYAMCLHLEIDRSYFEVVIQDYIKQFGHWIKYRGYLIGFEPLNIKKIYKEE